MEFMLTIRTQQMDAFARDLRRRFVERMVRHLARYFPGKCGELGDERIRDWIEHGIAAAAGYGLVAARDVCKYIDVMFVYGREFDSDGRHAWVRDILQNAQVTPEYKANLLIQSARRHASEGISNG